MEHLFAGWRLGPEPGIGADGRPYRQLLPEPGKTLFETIDQSDVGDDRTYVLCRRRRTFAILNVYPYTTGHVMVLPRRAVPSVLDLDDDEYRDLWDLVREAQSAVLAAFTPEGMNVGLNEGAAGGGSEPDHLHVHVVPRWSADTNFMTTVAEARVLPMTLAEAWERLRAAWPDPSDSSGDLSGPTGRPPSG